MQPETLHEVEIRRVSERPQLFADNRPLERHRELAKRPAPVRPQPTVRLVLDELGLGPEHVTGAQQERVDGR